MKFINELKEYILPKLGIVEAKDIDKIIADLSYAVKKMRDEGSKSMHTQLDWGTNEIPAANNEKPPASTGKSPNRKVTPKKTLPAKFTSSPSKSALKSTTPKHVAQEYQDEEDYEEEYMLDDEM